MIPNAKNGMHAQKAAEYKLVRLASGVFSVHSIAHGETFHPVIGPVAEAEALYIRQLRLRSRFQEHTSRADGRGIEFVIWDVGLGAAANALTVIQALQSIPGSLRLLSFDLTKGPLEFALENATPLEYLAGHESHLRALLNAHEVHFTHGQLAVNWTLHLGDFTELAHSSTAKRWPKPHAILFDAFSPAKNPQMWTQPLFAAIHELLDPDRPCAMPTYSRSTMLRVALLLAGFFVGNGHPTGEKEETTIAANTLDLIEEPLDPKWLTRARRSKSAEPLWTPEYRQAPLTARTWDRLLHHPQFQTRLAP